jgi:RNA recognition motif-containing protein
LFKLYVANLPWEVDGYELNQLFSEYGDVVHAKVLYRGSGARRCSRGFGFVTMATQQGSEDAIQDLNKQVSVWFGFTEMIDIAPSLSVGWC